MSLSYTNDIEITCNAVTFVIVRVSVNISTQQMPLKLTLTIMLNIITDKTKLTKY